MIPCTTYTSVSTDDIVAAAPPDYVALFEDTSSTDEYILGNVVYKQGPHWYDAMTLERIGKHRLGSLHFRRYAHKDHI